MKPETHSPGGINAIGCETLRAEEMVKDFAFLVERSLVDETMRAHLEGSIEDLLAWIPSDRLPLTELGQGMFLLTIHAHGLHTLVKELANSGQADEAERYHVIAQEFLSRVLEAWHVMELKEIANMHPRPEGLH